MTEKHILLLDNNPTHVEFFRAALLSSNDGPFQGEFATTLSQGLALLHQKRIVAIFANLSLPDSQGLDTFDRLLEAAPGVPVLILCGGPGRPCRGRHATRSKRLLA